MTPLIQALDRLPDNQLQWVLLQLSPAELYQLRDQVMTAAGYVDGVPATLGFITPASVIGAAGAGAAPVAAADAGGFDFGRLISGIGSALSSFAPLIQSAAPIISSFINPAQNFQPPFILPPGGQLPAPAPSAGGFNLNTTTLLIGGILLLALLRK